MHFSTILYGRPHGSLSRSRLRASQDLAFASSMARAKSYLDSTYRLPSSSTCVELFLLLLALVNPLLAWMAFSLSVWISVVQQYAPFLCGGLTLDIDALHASVTLCLSHVTSFSTLFPSAFSGQVFAIRTALNLAASNFLSDHFFFVSFSFGSSFLLFLLFSGGFYFISIILACDLRAFLHSPPLPSRLFFAKRRWRTM